MLTHEVTEGIRHGQSLGYEFDGELGRLPPTRIRLARIECAIRFVLERKRRFTRKQVERWVGHIAFVLFFGQPSVFQTGFIASYDDVI